jgi:hypothetical protein
MPSRSRNDSDTETLERIAARSVDELTPAEVAQVRRNLMAREAFVTEFGSPQNLELHTAMTLEAEGAVFSVEHRGTKVYPGFQFDQNLAPVPAAGWVLRILCEHRTPWEIALWFTANNGWLAGARPVDLLAEQSDEVIMAAQREVQHRVF